MAFSAWFFAVGPYADMRDHGGIVDERFGSGPDDVRQAIDEMGPPGRDAYRVFLLWDLLFPLLHAAWMAGSIAVGTRRWKALPLPAIGLPVLALLSDWIENLAFLVLLAEHPGMSYGVAVVAMVAMHAKLAFHVAAALVMLAIVVWMVMHPVTRRRR